MSPYDVIIKKVDPQQVASVRRLIPEPQMVGQMFEALYTGLVKQGAKPAGPASAIWHDMEHKEQEWDAEVVVAVTQAVSAGGEVQMVQLPGTEMACTIHSGSYEDLPQAYQALMSWIESNGYQITAGMREIYHRGPGPEPTDPSSYVTEIQVPVEKL